MSYAPESGHKQKKRSKVMLQEATPEQETGTSTSLEKNSELAMPNENVVRHDRRHIPLGFHQRFLEHYTENWRSSWHTQ